MSFFDDLLNTLNTSIFGKPEEINDPYISPTAQGLNPFLTSYTTSALGTTSPSQLYGINNNAYNQYLGQMQNLSSGILPSSYESQLSSIRDNSIQGAYDTFNSSMEQGTGGLLSGLANRGVINSSVMTDGLSQLGNQAYSALSGTISDANNTYSNSYLSGLTSLSDMANTSLGNALGYTSQLQDMTLTPALNLYSQELGLSPIISDSQDGFLQSLLNSLGSSIGSGASSSLFAK